MGTTWQDLLDMLVETRDADYRSDVERDEAIKNQMLYVMQTMLEKLRDEK